MSILRVEGMREDTRTPEERAALEEEEGRPLVMEGEAVLDRACRITGLHDFGDMEFLVRLENLLAEVKDDDNVWQTQKAAFVDNCVKAAANRLRIQSYLTEYPEVGSIPIDRPIDVIALPRSGSTHLENLLAADRRLRHLPVYLAAQPAPQPGEPPNDEGSDPRWTRSAARWDMLRQNQIMAAMHEHSPDHACGENELQIPDFSSYQWEWLAFVPNFRDYYLDHDQAPHYLYMRRVLQLIGYQVPNRKRWMLKSNQHSEQLGPLMTAYPDATVVMIHRDPVATLQSLLTMRGLAFKNSRKDLDIDIHVEYWVDRIERMLRRYMRDRHLVPSDQLVEVMFADLVKDDIATSAAVLERSGLETTDESRSDMVAYLESHPRGKGGRVVYDLQGDFGLQPEQLRERFAFYCDEFDIVPEIP